MSLLGSSQDGYDASRTEYNYVYPEVYQDYVIGGDSLEGDWIWMPCSVIAVEQTDEKTQLTVTMQHEYFYESDTVWIVTYDPQSSSDAKNIDVGDDINLYGQYTGHTDYTEPGTPYVDRVPTMTAYRGAVDYLFSNDAFVVAEYLSVKLTGGIETWRTEQAN
ncbi:MAG TPA: hypothetical protein PK567_02830 [Bacillota bacterium]|nr:hypothetical protein [Bacillota bacterium]